MHVFRGQDINVSRSLNKLVQLGAISWLLGMTAATLAGSDNGNVNIEDRQRFIGAWRLAWLEEVGADRNVHRADCTGLLVYTLDGHMSVQVMYRNQQAGSPYAQGATKPLMVLIGSIKPITRSLFMSKAHWCGPSSEKT
jgi:hypothetical protein